LTLIDIPELKSSANETLEFERNPDIMPKTGTKVWMIIEPVGGKEDKAPEKAAPDKTPTTPKAELPANESFPLPFPVLFAGAVTSAQCAAPSDAPAKAP